MSAHRNDVSTSDRINITAKIIAFPSVNRSEVARFRRHLPADCLCGGSQRTASFGGGVRAPHSTAAGVGRRVLAVARCKRAKSERSLPCVRSPAPLTP